MYVARRRLFNKEGKPDQSGYHLVVLAKNEKGYHNLIKLVSKAWTEGFYMRPRTDRVELEKYHERSEEHTSELQSPNLISYAVFC